MKQKEGQFLLSINQYFPKDFIRFAKEDRIIMAILLKNIAKKVREGIMNCDLKSSIFEIKDLPRQLFTLNPDELEIVEYALYSKENDLELKESAFKETDLVKSYAYSKLIVKIDLLLKRIRQFKNEHQR